VMAQVALRVFQSLAVGRLNLLCLLPGRHHFRTACRACARPWGARAFFKGRYEAGGDADCEADGEGEGRGREDATR
jgi:hypothetical protein